MKWNTNREAGLSDSNQNANPLGRTTNYAGGEGFEPKSPELKLMKLVINNLLQNTYYREDSEAVTEIDSAFKEVANGDNPEFAVKLAAYARQEMYLRQVSQYLLVLAANNKNTQPYVRKYAPDVISRADEPMEVYAIQIAQFGKPIPKPLRKGVNDALHNFNEYHFGKYNRTDKEVTLKDVLRLTRLPPYTEEQEKLRDKIMAGDLDDYPEIEPLETPHTWETVISEKGNTYEAWMSVLLSMGLMAKVRNVRNMVEAGVPEEQMLTEADLKYVGKSKMYPFRFYQAYRELERSGHISQYLTDWFALAIEQCLGTIPDGLEDSFIAIDLSGSMESSLSNRSAVTYKDIGSLFGAYLSQSGASVGLFGETYRRYQPNVGIDVLTATNQIRHSDVGHSTNGHLVFEELMRAGVSYERFIFFTDMQLWNHGWGGNTLNKAFDEYRMTVNPGAKLYMVDLNSYGDLTNPDGYHNVYNISGWNEKVLDFIKSVEEPDYMVQEVENYQIKSKNSF